MSDTPWDEILAVERPSLRALALRLLGTPAEVDDVLQEAWLRTAGHDPADLDNPAAWLRTVTARLCFDVLRARRRHPHDGDSSIPAIAAVTPSPEDDALVADEVSRALLVVLDRLDPVERTAFVLHDVFAVPFARIAPIVGKTPATTKKVASRARAKARGVAPAGEPDRFAAQRPVVEAFLAAARAGDLAGLLAVLAPDVVRHCDPQALAPGAPTELRGADAVARGAIALGARSGLAELAVVDGDVGVVVASNGALVVAVRFEVRDGRVAAYDVVADPARLAALPIHLLPDA